MQEFQNLDYSIQIAGEKSIVYLWGEDWGESVVEVVAVLVMLSLDTFLILLLHRVTAG